MNRDLGALLRTLVALALFAIVAGQTLGALRATGAWGRAAPRGAAGGATSPDPVAAVEALLARTEPPATGAVRDPFQVGAAPAPAARTGPVVRKPVLPPPPAQPVLTAIVFDSDPRALVRWQGRDWTVRPGALFDDFQVTGITRDQVTLTRGGETIVLQRKTQGD